MKNNIVILRGKIGTDLRSFGTAPNVGVSFRLATQRYVKKLNPPFETDWHDITIWGDDAAALLAAGATKGTNVQVSGQYTTDNFKDKTTGADRSKQVVKADGVLLLNLLPAQPQQQQAPAQPQAAPLAGVPAQPQVPRDPFASQAPPQYQG
jgi:single-strand DNA-binding protein